MCGIVAIVTLERDFGRATLDRMRDRLVHRGPDAEGSWLHDTGRSVVGLAHRRLTIIDLSEAADQPMFAADGQVAITYNGEIYNYIELCQELEAAGHRFRTSCDTEVLLRAYLEWGVDCLDHLNGMFAFAIYDRRRDHMFIARDRFGEKPLYYCRLPCGGLALASEVKALFAHPEIEAAIDEETFGRYLGGSYVEAGERTFFRDVYRFEPSHAMIVGGDGRISRKWRYWTPSYLDIDQDMTMDRATSEFRELLVRSVRMRLRSDVPVGVCLSGGLDSSTIAGIVNQISDERKTTRAYSVRFDDDPTISEGPYIDMVLQDTDLVANPVRPTPDQLIVASRRLHWHQEQPFLSASMFLEFALMRAAQENGTKVILDGQGADEVLGGYQYYFQLRQLDLMHSNRPRRLARETWAFSARLNEAAQGYKDVTRRFDPDFYYTLPQLHAKHEAYCSGEEPGDVPWKIGIPPTEPGKLFRRQLAIGLLYDQLPGNLHAADRSAMALGRETRFPYLDYDLVDWCIRLPDEILTRNGWLKYILRRASAGFIGNEVRWRADKVGYAAPQDAWLRGRLKDWAHDLLFSGPITERPEYDRAQLEACWTSHMQGDELSWSIWRWISASEWLRLFADNIWDESTVIHEQPETTRIDGGETATLAGDHAATWGDGTCLS